MLDEPTSYGERWTPARVLGVLDQTFPPESQFRRDFPEGPRITRLDGTSGDPGISSGEFGDSSGYWLDHAVPLNGRYRDLTAQFEFRRRDGEYAIALQDLHVL